MWHYHAAIVDVIVYHAYGHLPFAGGCTQQYITCTGLERKNDAVA